MNQKYELRLAVEPAPGRDWAASGRGMSPFDRPKPARIEMQGKGLALKSASRAVKSRPVFLPPKATADEAFRLTLQHCKWHIAANVPAVIEARDIEGVHQLRVALRRLRVALVAFGEEFRVPPLEALRIRAKILAQGLAPARDLDVFADNLFEPAARANGSLEAFAELRTRMAAARQKTWADAVREVSGLAFRTFMHDLGEAVDGRIWYETPRGGMPAGGLVAFDAPAMEVAGRMLARRLKMAKKRAKNLETLSEAKRHRLRIALKTMRYTADFFAPFYPEKNVKRFLKRLARMQDILGLLQDGVVARNMLARLIEEEGSPRADLSFAAGIVYGWHLDRAASAWKDAVRSWKKFTKTEPFWPI